MHCYFFVQEKLFLHTLSELWVDIIALHVAEGSQRNVSLETSRNLNSFRALEIQKIVLKTYSAHTVFVLERSKDIEQAV